MSHLLTKIINYKNLGFDVNKHQLESKDHKRIQTLHLASLWIE